MELMHFQNKNEKKNLEERGFEPRASRMRSEHSTSELHPLMEVSRQNCHKNKIRLSCLKTTTKSTNTSLTV